MAVNKPERNNLNNTDMARVKTISVKDYEKYNLTEFPNFDKSGSVTGMKNLYYGKDALLVRCGNYIYNVSSKPDIYDQAY